MNHFVFKRVLLVACVFCLAYGLQAQAPSGYYSAAKGKKGAALKTSLFGIVSDHTVRSYDQLWTDFKKTDVREDGMIWDMYSNVTNYRPGGSSQGANYKSEGDSYNREHSFPKSWFNDAKPMYTDLFHLYPTDGYVNNRRSNYPFGETAGEKYQSEGGFSKLGSCTVAGYSGTVFEPADEYKGDFARTYFYMATAYEDKIASWDSPMLAGNKYPAYANWALTMLLRWAEEDPVSEKETARNEAVYKIQKNRNPYIDFPGLEQYVWGSKTSTAFDPDNYEKGGSDTPSPVTVSAPVFSPAAGTVAKGTVVSLTTATEGAYIYYQIDGGEWQVQYPPVSLTVNGAMTITAYAQLGGDKSETVSAAYTLEGDAPVGENVYALVTSESELKAGAQLLLVCRNKGVALSAQGADIRSYASVSEGDDATITTLAGGSGLPYVLKLGGQAGAWTLYDQTGGVYLALTSAANKLHTTTSASETTAQWEIGIQGDGGTATVTNRKYDDRSIQYNASSPRFACYKSAQQSVSLFARVTGTGLARIAADNSDGSVKVYASDGRFIRSAAVGDALRGLPAGVYVVNGHKILVK